MELCHIDVILDSFDEFVISVTLRVDPFIMDKIETLLLAQEDMFEDKVLILDWFKQILFLKQSNWNISRQNSRNLGKVPYQICEKKWTYYS